MADINQVQLPDGSQYNITDTTSGYATQTYVQSAISGITKATIGLGNVDNTSDANKPVSTAQQTALDAKTNTSVIAYTEASTTATKRYEIGDQFILNGVLYTATAIIANGGTITVGTNCSASDTIVEQLANIGGSADNITFDNTGTDLAATNVQNAIVEVNEKTKHGVVEVWANPSPDSSFAGQTVNVTIDHDYDAYWVEYGEISSNAYFALGSIIIEKNGNGQMSLTYVTGGGKISRLYRNISLSISGSVASFVFADCTKQDLNSYGTAPSTITANAELFPRRIFGIIHND